MGLGEARITGAGAFFQRFGHQVEAADLFAGFKLAAVGDIVDGAGKGVIDRHMRAQGRGDEERADGKVLRRSVLAGWRLDGGGLGAHAASHN